MELLGAGSVLQLLLYMPNHKDFSQGTKRSIAALSETVYIQDKKTYRWCARNFNFVFDNHAIDLIPILRLTIILWDTISSREVNLGSSMKINQIATSLSG